MGANILASVAGFFGISMLVGDAPLAGIAFLVFAAMAWYKQPESDTIMAWIFTLAVIAVIHSWLFGGGVPEPPGSFGY